MDPHQVSDGNGWPAEEASVLDPSPVDALQATCRRQARVIDALHEAVRILQGGVDALKAENAELRAEAQERRVQQDFKSRRHLSLVEDRRMEVRLALDVQATAEAREAVADWVGAAVASSVLDHCKLLVSELVTNSVRHSGMPADEQVVVRVELTGANLRLEVQDPGCSGSVAPRPPDLESGGGFGLNLVEMVSEKWGVERAARSGTRVWAVLARAPDEMFATDGDRQERHSDGLRDT